MNTQVVFVRRPVGWVTEDCFELRQAPIPDPGPGDVLVRNIYVSCDPYLRGRMNEAFVLGDAIPARVVGQVAKSEHPRWKQGDLVWGFFGWEEWTLVARGEGLRRVDPSLGAISHFLSVLGMPGLTAWVGMVDIGRPQPGQTAYVSSAAGAVGSLAGQLARLAGARVVGSTGSDAKVNHCLEVLGFDACFNYKTVTSLDDALAHHCPDGIDVYFDNVGGDTLQAALRRLNDFARIPVCGMISGYNTTEDPGIKGLVNILARRATMTGLSIYDQMGRFEAWQPQMAALLRTRDLTYVEDIWEGIEQLPAAFLTMLEGDNIGKRLVRVGVDPTR